MTAIKQTLNTDRSIAEYGNELASLTDPKGKRFNRLMARDVVPKVERFADRRVIAVLGKEPPPRTYPGSPRFIWSNNPVKNANARRWFFANYPNGYKRTHKLVKAWQSTVTFKGAELSYELANAAPGAFYVYGAAEYGFQQVPGHLTTGWQNFGKEGADLVLEVVEFSNDTLADALEKEGKRL